MDVVPYVVHHLVKSVDLNHHGTLYAGRSAEWFVETGFIAAASLAPPQNIVCLKIHGMTFTRPVQPGSVVRYEGKIVHAGRTSLVAYVSATAKDEFLSEGFITFVHVDERGCACPHGIVITPSSPEDMALQERAKSLPRECSPS